MSALVSRTKTDSEWEVSSKSVFKRLLAEGDVTEVAFLLMILVQLLLRETSFSFFKESSRSMLLTILPAWFFTSSIFMLYTIFRLAQSLYAIRAAMGNKETNTNETNIFTIILVRIVRCSKLRVQVANLNPQ